jgi:tryptophan-rich sensory protein
MNLVKALRSGGQAGLAANIGLALGGCLLVNAVIFGLGWGRGTDDLARVSRLVPAGWVVGTVWVGLFALMGAGRWRLAAEASPGWLDHGARGEEAERARRWLDILLVNCIAYPLYTLGLSSATLGLLGNLVTAALAAWTARLAFPVSRKAAAVPLLVAGWVSFASIGILSTWSLR